MRILVAGATGQIARSLVETAQARGLELVALGRPNFDITHEREIANVVAEAAPSIVINAAAYTSVDMAETEPRAAHNLNADAAGYLARAAAKIDAAILQISTDYVFDGAKPTAYLETDAPAPVSVYGASKLAGERAVAAANPRHIIVRTAWVYSPFSHNFVRTMLKLAHEREEVSVVADQIGNPTYASDIAEALLTIAASLHSSKDHWGIFNLAGSGEASWADFAEAIFAESAAHGGPAARVRRIPTSEYPTAAHRPANSRLNCAKVERAYGIRLPTWRTSVSACVRRIAEQGS